MMYDNLQGIGNRGQDRFFLFRSTALADLFAFGLLGATIVLVAKLLAELPGGRRRGIEQMGV